MLLENLSVQTRRTPQQLLDFSNAAGRMYKIFDIEKRSGGVRTIEQPSRSVKALQRWLGKALFEYYPIHSMAMGYREGLSIRDNANVHSAYAYTLRMDFKDFFWSFKREDIVDFLYEGRGRIIDLSDADIEFASGIVTRNGRLVMGAPSSPILTNIMMYDLDGKFVDLSNKFGSKYTRYADDIFFSSSDIGVSKLIESDVKSIIKCSKRPILTLNLEKTAFLSKKNRRMVTGLVINSQGQVSLGRDRKKMIKSLLHRAIQRQLEDDRYDELAGLINWSKSADPNFVLSLRKKYGSECVDKFSNTSLIRRR